MIEDIRAFMALFEKLKLLQKERPDSHEEIKEDLLKLNLHIKLACGNLSERQRVEVSIWLRHLGQV